MNPYSEFHLCPDTFHLDERILNYLESSNKLSNDAENSQTCDSGQIIETNGSTLRELQSQVDDWIRTIGVRYFSELTNLAILMEETGELARLFARKFGDQSSKPTDLGRELSDEMADILFVLICLANQTGVDLTEAMKANLAKKTQRDSQRHRNNEKLRDV